MSSFKSVDAVCMKCGNVSEMQMNMSCMKASGNISENYCFCCKDYTKHYVVIDVSTFIYNNAQRDDIDDNTKKVLDMLLKREKNCYGRKR